MPLLSRHNNKAVTSGAPPRACQQAVASSSGANSTGQSRQAAVCESPLFGIRRQLPMVTTTSGAGEQRSPTRNSRSTSPIYHNDNNNIHHHHQLAQSDNINSPTTATSRARSSTQQQQQQQLVNENTLGSIPKQITRQQIHYAFTIMDTNSDGLIDVRDLSQMLANLGVPIDESILAHVLTGASKRGDRRISEGEFLEWFGHFVQVNEHDGERASASTRDDKSARTRLANKWSAASKWRKRPSPGAAASSSPVALGAEQPNADAMRRRRGSGSGLALMRSLSSSSSAPAPSGERQHEQLDEANDERQQNPASVAADLDEARNDLRAAFCVFDLDGDGFITLDEVRAGLKLLGESWTPSELDTVFSRCTSRPTTLRTPSERRQQISIEDFVQMLL